MATHNDRQEAKEQAKFELVASFMRLYTLTAGPDAYQDIASMAAGALRLGLALGGLGLAQRGQRGQCAVGACWFSRLPHMPMGRPSWSVRSATCRW